MDRLKLGVAIVLVLGGACTLGAGGSQREEEKKAENPAAAEAVIDGFIEILKSKSATFPQRRRACWGLAKRGEKAKRALPEATQFLQDVLERAERVKNKLLLGLEMLSLSAVLDTIPKIGANNQEALDALVAPLKKSKNADVRAGLCQGIALFADVSEKAFKVKAGVELQVVSEADTDPGVRRVARHGLTVVQGPLLGEVEIKLPAGSPDGVKLVDAFIKLPKVPRQVELMWGNHAPEGERAQIEVMPDGVMVIVTARVNPPEQGEEFSCLPGTYFVIVTDVEKKTGYLRVNVREGSR